MAETGLQGGKYLLSSLLEESGPDEGARQRGCGFLTALCNCRCRIRQKKKDKPAESGICPVLEYANKTDLPCSGGVRKAAAGNMKKTVRLSAAAVFLP